MAELDDELVRAAIDGDKEAVEELLRRGWHLSVLERVMHPYVSHAAAQKGAS